MHVFKSPSHAPLIVFPVSSNTPHTGGAICLSSMTRFKPRRRPSFPHFDEGARTFDPADSDEEIEELAEATERMTTNEAGEGTAGGQAEKDPTSELDVLPVWKLRPDGTDSGDVNVGAIKACAVGENGHLLLGVGEKEGVWIFRIPS